METRTQFHKFLIYEKATPQSTETTVISINGDGSMLYPYEKHKIGILHYSIHKHQFWGDCRSKCERQTIKLLEHNKKFLYGLGLENVLLNRTLNVLTIKEKMIS